MRKPSKMLSSSRVSGQVRAVPQKGDVWLTLGCLTAACWLSACSGAGVETADDPRPAEVIAANPPVALANPAAPKAREAAPAAKDDPRGRGAAKRTLLPQDAREHPTDLEEDGEDDEDEGAEDEEAEQFAEGEGSLGESLDSDDPDSDDAEDLDNDAPESLEGARQLSDAEVVEDARRLGIVTPADDRFFEVDDAPIRARLATMAIAKVKRGSGGRSLGFKITLEDGTKGYFKAEQTFSAANWNSEVAAYHLDRMLGFGRVPPVVSRKISWEDHLQGPARGDSRRSEVIVSEEGDVRGALVWWIPGGLRAWPDLPGFEKWIRVRGWPSTTVSSLQRPSVWAHQLNLRRKLGNDWLSPQERHRRRNFDPKPDRPDRAAELSDLLVFDYLTKNIDRWGGRNANVLIRDRGGPLVFLDNGAGFAPGLARPSLIESRLHVVQRFRRSTVKAVETFDIDQFQKRVEAEPLAPILHTREYRHLDERREALLVWIHAMMRRYGGRATPWE